MNIEVKDLMVGDWVNVKDYPMVAIPKQIKPEHFVRSLCWFEPIIITNDFLDNNGFDFTPTGNSFNSNEEPYGIYELEIENTILHYNNKYNEFKIFKDDKKCATFKINFVHEMQHILKIYKIDLEIKCI